jgi:hypothetical protein
MATQTDYFNRIGYRGKYQIGDRVFGYYQKIPFMGTVGNDRLISNITGPEVTIHLDLPMRLEDGLQNFIVVKHRDIKQRLLSLDEAIKPIAARAQRAAK